MSLDYYAQEAENDKYISKRIKDELGAAREKSAREIQREIRKPLNKTNPLAAPKIYKHSRQYIMANHTGYIKDETRYHPFSKAATHLWAQLEILVNWYHIFPRHIHGFIRRYIIPLEREFEFGNATPSLYQQILKLNAESFIEKLFKDKKYRFRYLTPRGGKCILGRNTNIIF